jgi:hypothetical protein
VKTDDRANRQRDEAEGDEAKVVRLSDWLGPDDELVPFGPRALAHAATREPAERTTGPDSGAEPPRASGFWEGDTSVHTAVPGPEIFDEPNERTADRRRYPRPAPVWRPARPRLQLANWGSHLRERVVDLVDLISWQWAAAGMTVVALVVVALVVTLGGSSGHRERTAQAGIGGQPRVTLSATLTETGAATRAAAVTALRRLPSVDAAVRTIGVATTRARSLQARHRPQVVVAAPASVASSATTGSVETPTTTTAPTETTSAPSETEPVQTTSNPTPTTGAGGTAAGGGPSSGSQRQSAFGAGGSLGPGSSPNG